MEDIDAIFGPMEALKNSYDELGYLELDLQLPNELIAQIRSDSDVIYRDELRQSHPPYYLPKARVMNAWKESPSVHELATLPRVMQLLEFLYGRKPRPFQTLNFPVGSEQAVHADRMHFCSAPSSYMCGLWVALEDIAMSSGPLVFYPRSHKLTEVGFREVRDAGYYDEQEYERRWDEESHGTRNPKELIRNPQWRGWLYQAYEQYIRDQIQKTGLKPKYGIIKKGHAILWQSNLLHGGARLQNAQISRHSLVTHYFFEKCAYYSPVMSDENWSFIQQVHWIPGNTGHV